MGHIRFIWLDAGFFLVLFAVLTSMQNAEGKNTEAHTSPRYTLVAMAFNLVFIYKKPHVHRKVCSNSGRIYDTHCYSKRRDNINQFFCG